MTHRVGAPPNTHAPLQMPLTLSRIASQDAYAKQVSRTNREIERYMILNYLPTIPTELLTMEIERRWRARWRDVQAMSIAFSRPRRSVQATWQKNLGRGRGGGRILDFLRPPPRPSMGKPKKPIKANKSGKPKKPIKANKSGKSKKPIKANKSKK